MKSVTLAIRIIGDATDALKAMDQASEKSNKFGRGLDTAAKWSAGALAAIAGAAWQAGAAASELEQSTGAVSSVFGEYAQQMTEYGQQAAEAVGLSQSEYGNMASILGSQLKNMGISLEESATQTNDLIGLGSDLAATFGGTTSEAVGALSSLLRGERDPIERYGVSIKQADIDAQKAAMGLEDLTGEAAKNADLQATLALLTAQTADAQGQFSRETDSAAGSAQIAAANFENAKAALGEALLPIMTEASEKLAELAKWFQENAAWITPLVGVIAGLAAGIIVLNVAYKAFAAVQAIQTAAQWASNAAWLASPITWIILAVIAAIAILVGVIMLVVKHWDQIRIIAIAVWQAVISWIKQVADWLTSKIIGAVQAVVNWFNNLRAGAIAVFQAVISWVRDAVAWLGSRLTAPIMRALQFFNNLRAGAVAVFQAIIQWVRDAIDWIANLASNAVPGWAKKLLGMSTASLMVTPEVQSLTTPTYLAKMAVTPTVADTDTQVAAPVAASNLTAMSGIMSAFATVAVPTLRASQHAAPTVIEDNRSYEINFPNYMGDKEEIIEELREALDKINQDREGIIHA